MVHIDTNKPGYEMRPGVDLWRIESCQEARAAKSGAQMLKLKLTRVSDSSDSVRDNIMLSGKGWGIGKSKLGAFLEPGFNGELDPLDLVGTEVWAETEIETYEYEGKKGERLAVNIKGLKHGGYQRYADVPPGKSLPEPVNEEEAPF